MNHGTNEQFKQHSVVNTTDKVVFFTDVEKEINFTLYDLVINNLSKQQNFFENLSKKLLSSQPFFHIV